MTSYLKSSLIFQKSYNSAKPQEIIPVAHCPYIIIEHHFKSNFIWQKLCLIYIYINYFKYIIAYENYDMLP